MAARKSAEESVADQAPLEQTVSDDQRAEALSVLLQGAAEDEAAVAASLETPAPVESEPVKWDGTGKYQVLPSSVMTGVVDGNYVTAPEGTVLLLSKELGERGVSLGVLEKL